MFDPVSQGLAAAAARSAYAAPLAFLAGAVTSVGPCVAPRFIAIAGMTAGAPRIRVWSLVAAFVAGLTATYAAFGAVSSLLARATAFSTYTYVLVAVALALSGVITLWRDGDRCDHRHEDPERRYTRGGAFLLGASFALVVSPCCTPLVAGILTYTSQAGTPLYGSALLACFALGHALPVLGVASGMSSVSSALGRFSVRQASSVVSATLMLGLAAYYAILA